MEKTCVITQKPITSDDQIYKKINYPRLTISGPRECIYLSKEGKEFFSKDMLPYIDEICRSFDKKNLNSKNKIDPVEVLNSPTSFFIFCYASSKYSDNVNCFLNKKYWYPYDVFCKDSYGGFISSQKKYFLQLYKNSPQLGFEKNKIFLCFSYGELVGKFSVTSLFEVCQLTGKLILGSEEQMLVDNMPVSSLEVEKLPEELRSEKFLSLLINASVARRNGLNSRMDVPYYTLDGYINTERLATGCFHIIEHGKEVLLSNNDELIDKKGRSYYFLRGKLLYEQENVFSRIVKNYGEASANYEGIE